MYRRKRRRRKWGDYYTRGVCPRNTNKTRSCGQGEAKKKEKNEA